MVDVNLQRVVVADALRKPGPCVRQGWICPRGSSRNVVASGGNWSIRQGGGKTTWVKSGTWRSRTNSWKWLVGVYPDNFVVAMGTNIAHAQRGVRRDLLLNSKGP